MKSFWRIVPWCFVALFAAEILAVMAPKKDGEYHVREFARLPVLLNGRIQPFDSVARNSLLQIRSTGDVPLEIVPSWKFWHHPKKLKATEWLLEVMTRPEVADTRSIFLIHHAELLGELKLQDKGIEKSGLRYYTFNDLKPVINIISEQGRKASELKAEEQSSFQKQAIKLAHAAMLYQRLKVTLQPEGGDDFVKVVSDFKANLAAAQAAAQASEKGANFDKAALDRIAQPVRDFQLMANFGYPLIVPPPSPSVARDKWQNLGNALLDSAKDNEIQPAAGFYVAMGTAYRQQKPEEFNQAVAGYQQWLAPRFEKEARKGRAEFYFYEVKAFLHATIIYIFAFVLAGASILTLNLGSILPESLRRSALYLVVLAGIVHTSGLVFRMVLEGRPPVTNLYSSAIFIGWATMVTGIIIERIYRVGLGVLVASLAGFVTLLIAHNLSMDGDTMEMLRAVLDTNFWLATHVVVITLGYAATFFAGLLAIVYVSLGIFSPLLSQKLQAAAGSPSTGTTIEFGKILSRMVYGVVCFATLFSFVGTVLGGIWADQSWGRFWGWDPKENGALLIVLWNAIILHARWGGLVRERGLMNLAIFGNVVTSFSWFGVNMLGVGLHAYGFREGGFQWLSLFLLSQVFLIGNGGLATRWWRSFSPSKDQTGRTVRLMMLFLNVAGFVFALTTVIALQLQLPRLIHVGTILCITITAILWLVIAVLFIFFRTDRNMKLGSAKTATKLATILAISIVLPAIFRPALSYAADTSPATTAAAEDPFLWLENVTGEKALDWVKEQNVLSTKELEAAPEFEVIRRRILSIMDSKEKIPYVAKHGRFYYNFWRDEQHVRGLWRRTSLEEFKKASPQWETVLDIDELATKDNENWVWKGYEVLYPSYDRCLVSLSRGGADAVVTREFDLGTKSFVKDGFYLKEAKSSVSWRNRDSIYVGTDFGAGSLTSSGYPRVIKLWNRGTPLDSASVVFEGKSEDVGVDPSVVHDHGRTYEFIRRGPTFFTSEEFVRRGEQWVKIEKPDDAIIFTFDDQLLLRLRSVWTVEGKTYSAGSLLAANFEDYLKGSRKFETLFLPTERTSLENTTDTKNFLVLNELNNVRNKLTVLRHREGKWERSSLKMPDFGAVSINGIDADESDDYFLTVTDYLTPTSLYYGTLGQENREKLKNLPAFFDAQGLQITQHETTSKDGTKVPYFQVSRKGMAVDGKNPTLLYGYGGFEISMLPNYSAAVGSAWLERGGTYVVANIRGGGEFGPRWHEAARKANRQRAYDDFISVAEDLIGRKVTSPQHLGIQGGSNGGLLMGVMLTQRPDLFKAVVCQVPLLDMRRFNKLLAGASWMAEFGNPDNPDEWAYIGKYSPYQNVKAQTHYPRVLFMTSTRDDRVHPGHARKMVARMKEQGHDVLYYENTEGGHGGAANNKQAARMWGLAYTFLLKELGLAAPASVASESKS